VDKHEPCYPKSAPIPGQPGRPCPAFHPGESLVSDRRRLPPRSLTCLPAARISLQIRATEFTNPKGQEVFGSSANGATPVCSSALAISPLKRPRPGKPINWKRRAELNGE
jgi:hypothetical protein